MPDLDERLHGVDRISTPDLWGTIEDRSLAAPPRLDRRRLVTAAVALAVAAASTAALIATFDGVDGRPAIRPGVNGLIVYTDLGPQPPSIPFENLDVFAFDPASGERVNLTNSPTVAEQSLVWSPDGAKVLFQRTIASGEGAELQIARQFVVANADFSEASVIQECTEGCDGVDFAWSADGSRLAWSGTQRVANGFIVVLRIHDLAAGVTATAECEWPRCRAPGQPAWSPDGTKIAFSQSGSSRFPGVLIQTGPIWVTDATGGDVTAITSTPNECRIDQARTCIFDSWPAWSPDGGSIAFVRTSGWGQPEATTDVVVARADGSNPRTLFVCTSNDQCQQGPVLWAPHGDTIAFVARYDDPSVHLIDPSSGIDRVIELPASAAHPYRLVWSPDGSRIAFLAGGDIPDLYEIDVESGEVRGLAPQLTTQGDLAWLPADAIEPPAGASPSAEPTAAPETAAPTGTIAFKSSNGSSDEDAGTEIWTIRTDGSELRRLTVNETFDGDPAITADGTRIAFASYRAGDRNSQVYVMNADGTDQHVLTDRRTGATQPVWSPDGSRIAFVSSAGFGEEGGVFVINADGSDQRLVAEGNAFDPAWSPDASRIVYSLNDTNGDTHLWVVDLETGSQEPLPELPGAQSEPAWSPDGQTIAFRWWSPGGEAIYTVRPDGSDLRKIASGSEPTWSPDGSWLAFTHVDEETGPQIWLVDSLGRGAHALTSMEGFARDSLIYAITGGPSWTAVQP
jgi:Tol biopolymer transport system component